MTLFEDFVNLELPRRSALLTNAIVSYDDNPNLSSAPAILKGAPLGTWFYEETANIWWRKIGSGATDWENNAGGSVDRTIEDLTITIDQVNGNDANVRFFTQDEYDAYGSFATLPYALRSIPTHLYHPVKIQFVDGTYTLTSEDFAELSRFTFGTRNIDSFSYDDGAGTIIFQSSSGLTRVPGTSAMAVSSSTTEVITLASDPGFAADAYQGYFIRVASGTGSGQIKPLRTHSGTSFTVTPRFSPAPNNTSTVEIVSSPVTWEIDEPTSWVWVLRSSNETFSTLVHCGIVFDGIDIVPAAGISYIFFELESGAYLLTGGTRLLGVRYYSFLDTKLFLETCVIDYQGKGVPAGSGIITIQRGIIRSFTDSTLIRNSSGAGSGISMNGSVIGESSGYLFYMAIDDCGGDAISATGTGSTIYIQNIHGTGNSGYGVSVSEGASLKRGSGTDVTGTSGDMSIDGVSKTYDELDAEEDGLFVGVYGSKAYNT